MARPGVNKLVLIIAAAAYIGWIWLSLPVPSPASKPVTVVSAYYEIPSKHSPAEYLQWTEHLVRIDCHLVLFCEGAMNCGRFRRLRPDDPTCLVIEWPLAQTDMASLESMWRDQITKDPEFHLHRSHWLYIVWAQKAWFVKKAEELDPFGSDLFLWMDAGAFRDPARLPLFEKGWPSLERALALTEQGSRVAGLAINPFPESPAPFLVGDYLAGTSLLASRRCWDRFRELYWRALVSLVHQDKFVGKDQTVYNSVYLAAPGLFNLVDARRASYDPWFYMQDLLAAE